MENIDSLFAEAELLEESNDSFNLHNKLIQISQALEPDLTPEQTAELQHHFDKIKRLYNNIKIEDENLSLLATPPRARIFFMRGLNELLEYLKEVYENGRTGN